MKIIIVGSGNSVPFSKGKYLKTGNGVSDKLTKVIQNNYSFGLNYFFKFGCVTTSNLSVDWQFYLDNLKELENVPSIIASEDSHLIKNNCCWPNTILVKDSGEYHGKDSLKKGVYCRYLVGIFSISLAIALGFKEIYLLGFDCCEINDKTHFYQDLADLNKKSKASPTQNVFRGVGKNGDKYKSSPYNKIQNLNNFRFKPIYEQTDAKIYNVSLESKLNGFEKISYHTFYEKIGDNKINHKDARKQIKEKILDEKRHQKNLL